jgi:hypothetical protein
VLKHHTIKRFREYGSKPICILDLGTARKWVVLFMFWPLYPLGKEPLVSIGYEAEWSPVPVWMWLEREKSLHLPGTEPPSSILLPVTFTGSSLVVKYINRTHKYLLQTLSPPSYSLFLIILISHLTLYSLCSWYAVIKLHTNQLINQAVHLYMLERCLGLQFHNKCLILG